MPNITIYVNHDLYEALSREAELKKYTRPATMAKKIVENWFTEQQNDK